MRTAILLSLSVAVLACDPTPSVRNMQSYKPGAPAKSSEPLCKGNPGGVTKDYTSVITSTVTEGERKLNLDGK